MKTTQAWGWLTAGVLALGLNGVYQDGGAAWAHRTVGRIVGRIAEQTEPVLALATGRADRFMAKTGMLGARSETTACRLATSVARIQTRIVRTQTGFDGFEAMSARQEAALTRMEANRARIEAQVAAVQIAPVIFDSAKNSLFCPRVRVNVPRISTPRVNFPRLNIPRIDVPQVSIPRVSIPEIPAVNIPAPVVLAEMSGTKF